ncbi:ABC transporter permease [Pandoraea terrae]|uniref:ABC transporter permease n=1 Tax=Pandoraea terrae TaxID=1537710 RepID=A0A5E4TVE2_9BURK|nr:dihydrodipicolinate synthase family protein [Pandoraea terrae]VVD91202.1 ABC transporter permease [Pandoraea terrae]
MMDSTRLQGIFAAIPTPVHTDGTIHEAGTRALLDFQRAQGADGVVPLGGTGEYGSMSQASRVRMIELCTEHLGGKMPVIAGVLTPGLPDALAAAKDYAQAGADALMVITPYYTNPTQDGIRDYFLRFADQSPLPVLLYEIPYRTRIAINPSVIHELSRHERIIGMKACNTDIWHFLKTVAGVADDFSVLSGEDTHFPLHVAAGAKGGILATASLLPKTWRRLFDQVRAGDLNGALVTHRQLIPFIDLVFSETNPGPMKSVMDLIGIDAPEVLAPLVKPAGQVREGLRAEYSRLLETLESV